MYIQQHRIHIQSTYAKPHRRLAKVCGFLFGFMLNFFYLCYRKWNKPNFCRLQHRPHSPDACNAEIAPTATRCMFATFVFLLHVLFVSFSCQIFLFTSFLVFSFLPLSYEYVQQVKLHGWVQLNFICAFSALELTKKSALARAKLHIAILENSVLEYFNCNSSGSSNSGTSVYLPACQHILCKAGKPQAPIANELRQPANCSVLHSYTCAARVPVAIRLQECSNTGTQHATFSYMCVCM